MKKKEALVKVTLMQADLEFEYPQKLEKLLVRNDLVKWLDEEEDKLKRNAKESILLMDEAMTGAAAKTKEEEKKEYLTYEDYYNLDDFVVGGLDDGGQKPGKIPFEEFAAKTASENIFDNDLLEQQYKFWESMEDRENRLRRIWIDLKRKNALGGIDAVTQEEHLEINKEIVETIRRIRWRTDQELTRRNIDPIFKDNYAGKYDKEEFLIDAGLEFFKVKKLLSKNPRLLKDDPVLSIDYYKIINLIKRQKILENSSDPFKSEETPTSTWNDLKMVDEHEKDKAQKILERFRRQRQFEGESTQDFSEKMNLSTTIEETEESVKTKKKKEVREHQKIIQQFDKLATQFASSKGADSTQKTVGKMGGEAVAETAGMLKKKQKKRKEKSLSAKLRLKEKKGTSDKK